MQARTRTAALLLAATMVAAGCGPKATGSVGTSTGLDAPAENAAVVTTTSTTSVVDTLASEPVAGEPNETAAETTTVAPAPAPDVSVDEIDSLLAGLDETLAELDQLLNQAAAALAAEEGEILP